ncbi:MAG: hypothetical protein ACTHK4_17775 [Mycobacteriales bacterium]
MRRPTSARLIVAFAAVSAAVFAATASDAAPAAHAGTVQIFVAPVKASGHHAPGFTVVSEHGGDVFCNPADPSPVSVSANVEECSPSVEYAVACWLSSRAGRVLCLRNPRKAVLSSIRLSGPFADTPPVSAHRLSPFYLLLSDGAVCSIRDGGAWATLKSHPNYRGTYSCTKNGDVWSKPHAAHSGVDETSAVWTVQTASAKGTGPLTTRHVAKAYFVETAS